MEELENYMKHEVESAPVPQGLEERVLDAIAESDSIDDEVVDSDVSLAHKLAAPNLFAQHRVKAIWAVAAIMVLVVGYGIGLSLGLGLSLTPLNDRAAVGPTQIAKGPPVGAPVGGLLTLGKPRDELAAETTAQKNEGDASIASDAVAGAQVSRATGQPPNSGIPPTLVRTVSADIRVKEGKFTSQWQRAHAAVASFGGYVENESTSSGGGLTYGPSGERVTTGSSAERITAGFMTVRVPADRLDAFTNKLRELGTLVNYTGSSSDVGAQLVDYDARIRSSQTRETALLEILRQAKSISDVLQIRQSLDSVRTEIESMQAQKKSIETQVALASVSVSMHEPGSDSISRPWPVGLSAAWRAMYVTALGLLTVLAVLVPIALVVGLPLWLVLRRRRKA